MTKRTPAKKNTKLADTKLLYLSMLSFVFISSSGLALSRKDVQPQVTVHVPEVLGSTDSYTNLPFLPVLYPHSSFPIFSAQSVLAVDIDSGVVLYEKSPDTKLLPASTTKIVTALVALDFYPLDMPLTVGPVSVPGQKMNLVQGEIMTVENLLYGLLVYSANDAAEVLAANYPGGRASFIDTMNKKALSVAMTNSHFENPTGLENLGHISTARDMVRVTQVAMQDPTFSKMVATQKITVTNIDGTIVHKLQNINELLGVVAGIKGVKTGWTENARENLVTYIERDGRNIVMAVLGSQDRFGETTELVDWIFENYSWEPITPYFSSLSAPTPAQRY